MERSSRRTVPLTSTLFDDLSVITVDGRPYTSLISAHYLKGLGPTQIASFQEVGPAVGRLSVGIGNIARSAAKFGHRDAFSVTDACH
jgi:hypothetical protein